MTRVLIVKTGETLPKIRAQYAKHSRVWYR